MPGLGVLAEVAGGSVRLFQPFQRSGADRTGARDGQGVGLSIVAAVAEAHGAWLRASALTGGGLRVQAGFPQRVSPPPAGVTQAPAVLPPQVGGAHLISHNQHSRDPN